MSTRDDFYRRLGRRVTELRKAAGLSQRDLASVAGVGASYVAHIEAGHSNITLDVLRKIADALHVDPSELISPSSAKADQATDRGKLERIAKQLQSDVTDLLTALGKKAGRR